MRPLPAWRGNASVRLSPPRPFAASAMPRPIIISAPWEGADEGEIITVAVSPACRRQGIARALMEHMLRLAAGARATVYLEVRASNTPARELYRTLGFTETGVRKNYYTSPREDAVLMMRSHGAQEILSC